MMTSTQKSPAEIAQILEGVDFIETEEDAKAVEAATLKIQSTFRGKKIRSKLGGQQQQQPAKAAEASDSKGAAAAQELSKQVAEMQVNDKKQEASGAATAPVEEAERAATKIQAGFKGYKTRKELELEGKLPASGAPAGGAAPNSAETSQQSAQDEAKS